MPGGCHWQLGCANLPVRTVCCLSCHSAVAGISVLLQSRMLPLVSLAEQDHILQHWGNMQLSSSQTLQKISGTISVAEKCGLMSSFCRLVVSFVGCRALSLCLWMVFGKSTGERPGRCGVSMADEVFAMYVFQKCVVPGLLPLPPLHCSVKL